MLAVTRLPLPAMLLLIAVLTLVACGSEVNENARNVHTIKQGNVEISFALPDGDVISTDLDEIHFVPSDMEPVFYANIEGDDKIYASTFAVLYTPEIVVSAQPSGSELNEYLNNYGDRIENIEKSEPSFLQRESTTFAGYPADAFGWLMAGTPGATYEYFHTKYIPFMADSRRWSFECRAHSDNASEVFRICDDVIASVESK